MERVYTDLRRLASKYMRDERKGHTLSPTALVHEAYLRMRGIAPREWRGRTHFFATAAIQMRRILVEYARGRSSRKRGGGGRRVPLHEGIAWTPERSTELLALDEALRTLEQEHERRGRVAEMRLFAGMKVKEIAAALDVSERTVKSDWSMARACLARVLSRTLPSESADLDRLGNE